MQTTLEIHKLKPLGTKVMVKQLPEDERIKSFYIPEQYRTNKDGQIFTGVVIAVGDRTKSARFGHDRDWFEPADKVWFWAMWDWNDREVVLKDEKTGDNYLMIDESEIKAFEIQEASCS